MALFSGRSDTDAANSYGYATPTKTGIDLEQGTPRAQHYARVTSNRPLEVAIYQASRQSKQPDIPGVTQQHIRWHNEVCRQAFYAAGILHSWGPLQTWYRVRATLEDLRVAQDDICDFERVCMGWKEITMAEVERYRYRYPGDCPLVEALVPFAGDHQELKELRAWIAEVKAVIPKDPSVLPVAPGGGVRPSGVPDAAAQIPEPVQTNQK